MLKNQNHGQVTLYSQILIGVVATALGTGIIVALTQIIEEHPIPVGILLCIVLLIIAIIMYKTLSWELKIYRGKTKVESVCGDMIQNQMDRIIKYEKELGQKADLDQYTIFCIMRDGSIDDKETKKKFFTAKGFGIKFIILHSDSAARESIFEYSAAHILCDKFGAVRMLVTSFETMTIYSKTPGKYEGVLVKNKDFAQTFREMIKKHTV